MLQDIIYVLVLLVCVGFGHYYRQIRDVKARQWAATGFGLLACFVVTGKELVHPIICTIVSGIIITKVHWKTSHLATLGFTFWYMIGFFRLPFLYGIPESSTYTNLIIMILALKLSGLAFEINAARSAPEDDVQGVNAPALKEIGLLDVFHYAFNYCGVLTGPYYRYRTYWDCLHRPFADKADHLSATIEKLKSAAIFCVGYLVLDQFYGIRHALTDEFADRSYLYKLWFMYPAFVVFKLRLYTGMILSECVCTMAGLGAYPTSCDPVYGMGPRNYKCIEELSKTPEKVKTEDLDFETVHNMYPAELEKSYTVRRAMRSWNTTIQYWMAFVIYKKFPIKPLRAAATLTVSAVWHGWAPGYFMTICQVALYLPPEDIWMKIRENLPSESLSRTLLTAALWLNRTTCMAYMGISFQILEFWPSVKYYNSIYWTGHIALFLMYISGLLLKPYLVPKKAEDDKDKSKQSEKKSG